MTTQAADDDEADEGSAKDAFYTHLDLVRFAQDRGITLAKARRLWGKVRRRMAREAFTEGAAREFAAETDEALARVAQTLYENIVAYNGGDEKLNCLASAGKQFKDLADFRIKLRQDLGILPSVVRPATGGKCPPPASKKAKDSSAAEAAPPPVIEAAPAPVTNEQQLVAAIAALETELSRVRRDAE